MGPCGKLIFQECFHFYFILYLFQPLNLTDFYVDVSVEISSSGTTTNGLLLNIVTNSSTARDLSDQVVTSSGIYNTNWAGFTVGVNPVSSSLSLSASLESNSTSQMLGSKGAYANLRTQLRLAISVTNGTQISVCYLKQLLPIILLISGCSLPIANWLFAFI